MKKIISCIACLLMTLIAMTQEKAADDAFATTRQDFLNKAKKQKTAALGLLIGGGALTIGGIAWAANDFEIDLNGIFDPNYQEPEDNSTAQGVLILTGAAAMLGSIPLFIASRKNRRRAMEISFKNEWVPQLQNNLVYQRAIPAISLRISL